MRFCACTISRWSTGQGQKFAVVKRSMFRRSKILTPVAALGTARMGVTHLKMDGSVANVTMDMMENTRPFIEEVLKEAKLGYSS